MTTMRPRTSTTSTVVPYSALEPFAGEHFLRGADRPLPADEVQHAVDVREDRIDLVGDEEHRGVRLAAAPVDQLAHDLLLREVEREQGLVAQQNVRIGDERLRDAQALLLAARESPDGRVGVVAGADRVDRGVDRGT